MEIPSNLIIKRVNPAFWCGHTAGRGERSARLNEARSPSLRAATALGRLLRIGTIVVAFGVCSTSMAFVASFANLLTVRAFLGVAEGGSVVRPSLHPEDPDQRC